MSPRLRQVLVLAAFVALAAGLIVWSTQSDVRPPGRAAGTIVARLTDTPPSARDLQAYTRLAAWVDGFDYGPAYQKGGAPPPVTPKAIDDMAAAGVTTLFLQAVRDDPRSPGGVVDHARVGEFLMRAHRKGMRVVGWYLPKFADLDLDLANLQQIMGFDALGHRFDGVAVDIEDVEDVADVNDRNQRLIELSRRVRSLSGADAVGAIVLPPVLTEVVNPRYWPDFPWTELHALYNVWLPMSYWTFRTRASGYHDGYTYADESVRRLRNNLGDQGALVHDIGGIGDTATVEEIDRFIASLADNRAIGGSIYDWASMGATTRQALSAGFATGKAATLPAPP